MTGRTLARSQALQILFQAEATSRSVDDVLSGDYALSEGPLDPFGELLARGCGAMLPTLDAIISCDSQNWGLGRMPSVDRNLLRLAIFEMLHVEEVAVAVTISESVVLAKAYGSDDSSRFINGILGRVARDLEAGIDVEASALEQQAAQVAAEEAAKAAAQEAAKAAADAAQADDAQGKTKGEADATGEAKDHD
jgi:N utilization substance protein B